MKYLDYPFPPDEDSPAVKGWFNHYWRDWDDYPAMGALLGVGKPAVPELIAAIADAATSPVKRRCAIGVILRTYLDPPETVEVLMHAGAELFKTDIQAGMRVLQAAKEVVTLCVERYKVACNAAMYK